MNTHPIDTLSTLPLRRPYLPPQVLCELRLETRAGSPLNLPDLLDPADKPDLQNPASPGRLKPPS